MAEQFIKSLAENGLLGLLLALSLLVIYWLYIGNKKELDKQRQHSEELVKNMDTTHRSDRSEMMRQFNEQHKEVVALSKDFNVTTKETMSVVSEIRGILQTNRKLH